VYVREDEVKQPFRENAPQPSAETGPKPARVIEFANFFKRYMSISSVIAAALPIPVTAFGLIPVYSSQKPYLSTYTSLFCFLALGYVFYNRHSLALRLFPKLLGGLEREEDTREHTPVATLFLRNWDRLTQAYNQISLASLPLLLILLSFTSVMTYHYYLTQSLSGSANPAAVLKDTTFNDIRYGLQLTASYLGIFITAEAAFILMAIKEYLQDMLGLNDMEILSGYQAATKAELWRILGRTSGTSSARSAEGPPESGDRHGDDATPER
jgi:hypothetical protein